MTATTRVLAGWGGRPRSAAHVAPPEPWDGEPTASLPDRGVVARGLGRSYGDAAQNAGGLVYDMTACRGVRGFDAERGLVTVAAGTSLDELMRAVVPFGWFVAVTPGTRAVTVGGAIAADIHGKNHHQDGSFCDHVTELALTTGAGEHLIVTPEESPEVFWATAAGMGLTGVITEATLALLPIETSRMRVETERAADLDDVMARMSGGDAGYRYSVAWVDLLATGGSLGRAVLTRGDHAGLDELTDELSGGDRADPLAYGPHTRLGMPPLAPSGALRPTTVRGLNSVWFHKAPRRPRTELTSIPAFFHPLDAVGNWNRVYGPRGFVQYQFVVPFGAEETLRRVVGRLSAARTPSFLTVLKRFGAEQALLGFPMPGWTLAVDIPVGVEGLAELLDACDELVAAAGGRVYLAKDARLRLEAFRAMYPGLGRWQRVRDRLDPHGRMRSDLARRLELVPDP